MTTGDRVEVKEFTGSKWEWKKRFGRITRVDMYCYSVRTDDGEDIRDIHEHFREVES